MATIEQFIESFRANESRGEPSAGETFQNFLDTVAPVRESDQSSGSDTAGEVFQQVLDTVAPVEQKAESKKRKMEQKISIPEQPKKKVAKEVKPSPKTCKHEPKKQKVAHTTEVKKPETKTYEQTSIPRVATVNLDIYLCSQCCMDMHN